MSYIQGKDYKAQVQQLSQRIQVPPLTATVSYLLNKLSTIDIKSRSFLLRGNLFQGLYHQKQDSFRGRLFIGNSVFCGEFGLRRANRECMIINERGVYQGEIQNWIPQGWGTFTFVDGPKTFCKWEKGKPNGFIVQTFSNGDRFMGNFQNGKKEGKGHYMSKGTVFQGQFQNGKIKEGILYDNLGNSFKGQFKEGKPYQGTIFYKNKTIYSGQLVDFQKEGPGKLTTEFVAFEGRWKAGQLVQGDAKDSQGVFYSLRDIKIVNINN